MSDGGLPLLALGVNHGLVVWDIGRNEEQWTMVRHMTGDITVL